MRDLKLYLANDQDLSTETVGTVAGETVLNLQSYTDYFGNSAIAHGGVEQVLVKAVVKTTVTGGSTLQIIIIESAAAAMSSPTTLITGVASSANPAAGTVLLEAYLPLSQAKQYLRANIVVGTDTVDTGAVDIWLSPQAVAGQPA